MFGCRYCRATTLESGTVPFSVVTSSAEVDGSTVTLVTFAATRGVSVVFFTPSVEVAVTVDDAWQRRGLGSLLLARVLARARENGYQVARGSVLAENRPSRALLRMAGFRVRGRDGLLIEFERSLSGASGWLGLATAS